MVPILPQPTGAQVVAQGKDLIELMPEFVADTRTPLFDFIGIPGFAEETVDGNLPFRLGNTVPFAGSGKPSVSQPCTCCVRKVTVVSGPISQVSAGATNARRLWT